VDGRRVLSTGDQQTGSWIAGEQAEIPNFQYANGFRADDYARSAALYQRLRPELMISGHWQPRLVSADYLDHLGELGEAVARAHRALLPPTDPVFGATAATVRISPYRISAQAGKPFDVRVLTDGPELAVSLTVPAGWECEPTTQLIHGEAIFTVVPRTDVPLRRARIAAGVTRDGRYLGQLAEALADVRT